MKFLSTLRCYPGDRRPTVRLFSLLCDICSESVSEVETSHLSANEWDELWELVLRHKVAPQFFLAINGKSLKPPGRIKLKAESLAQKNLYRAMLHSRELVRINERFNEKNVAYLNFKGVALLGLLGKALNQRHSGDIDILLVSATDLIIADSVLLNMGYSRDTMIDLSLLESPWKLTKLNVKDISYFDVQRNIKIELHVKLFPANLLPVDPQELYLNRDEIPIGSAHIPVMSLFHHRMYLLVHGSISNWHRLKWLLDIPLVSDGGGLYDEEFEETCRKLGIGRVVSQGVLLANQILKMPTSVSDRNLDLPTKFVMRVAKWHIFQEKSLHDREGIRFVLHHACNCCVYWPMLRSEFRYKIACMKILCIGPRDYKVLPLPLKLYWLYIPLRPFLWMRRQLVKEVY